MGRLMLNDSVDDLVSEILTPGPEREPYDAYRRLREEAPAHRSEATGVWSLTRYDDVKAILHDRRFGRGRDLRAPGLAGLVGAVDAGRDRLRVMGDTMLFADPPEHGRLRGLVSRAFTPRRIEALRPAI